MKGVLLVVGVLLLAGCATPDNDPELSDESNPPSSAPAESAHKPESSRMDI